MSLKVDTMLFELARARDDERRSKVNIEKVQAKLEQTEEWIDLQQMKETLSKIQSGIALIENDTRAVALAEYTESQLKDLGGVQIKTFTVLEYDENTAVNYCLEHQHAKLLKLDKRGFEKVAKELQPEFVTIKEEPRAQIASDLSEYL